MMRCLRLRPWVWVTLSFVLVFVSWIFLVRLANKYAPQPIAPTSPSTQRTT